MYLNYIIWWFIYSGRWWRWWSCVVSSISGQISHGIMAWMGNPTETIHCMMTNSSAFFFFHAMKKNLSICKTRWYFLGAAQSEQIVTTASAPSCGRTLPCERSAPAPSVWSVSGGTFQPRWGEAVGRSLPRQWFYVGFQSSNIYIYICVCVVCLWIIYMYIYNIIVYILINYMWIIYIYQLIIFWLYIYDMLIINGLYIYIYIIIYIMCIYIRNYIYIMYVIIFTLVDWWLSYTQSGPLDHDRGFFGGWQQVWPNSTTVDLW